MWNLLWNDRTHWSAGTICIPNPNPRKDRIFFAPFTVLSGDDARCSWRSVHARHRPGNTLITAELQNTQHGFRCGQPSPTPVMGVCHPAPPPSLPTPPAPTNHSAPCMARADLGAKLSDWAGSVLGAKTHGGNAARPWLGTRGPTHPCRPEIRDMQHRNLRRESRAAKRMLPLWFVVVRQPQTHSEA